MLISLPLTARTQLAVTHWAPLVRYATLTAANLGHVSISNPGLTIARLGSRTHADVAANISIFRAFVIRARASEKQAENTTITPRRRVFAWIRKRRRTEQSGSINATIVLANRVIARNVWSSYSYSPDPKCLETGRYDILLRVSLLHSVFLSSP